MSNKPGDAADESITSPSLRNLENDSLERVASEVSTCTLCPLSKSRTKAVPGEGNPHAQLMLVGEGPGYNEDRQGRPFVGAAGSFLNELLGSVGLKRQDVFITNVVKCRPPQNRDPLPGEIHACAGYLQRQLNLIQPEVLATLGRHSMAKYFPGERISKIHGQPKRLGELTVVPLFHPAAALHQPALKAAEIDDFSKLPGIMAEAARGRPEEPAPATEAGASEAPAAPEQSQSPNQLKLFE